MTGKMLAHLFAEVDRLRTENERYKALVQEVADMDPLVHFEDGMGAGCECRFCEAFKREKEDVQHTDGCLWLRYRSLVSPAKVPAP